jgi:hypothetical protein
MDRHSLVDYRPAREEFSMARTAGDDARAGILEAAETLFS